MQLPVPGTHYAHLAMQESKSLLRNGFPCWIASTLYTEIILSIMMLNYTSHPSTSSRMYFKFHPMHYRWKDCDFSISETLLSMSAATVVAFLAPVVFFPLGFDNRQRFWCTHWQMQLTALLHDHRLIERGEKPRNPFMSYRIPSPDWCILVLSLSYWSTPLISYL